MKAKKMELMGLSEDQIRQIFELEKSLAYKLRTARKEDRRKLYGPIYDEYFSSLSFHPQLIIKANPELLDQKIAFQLKIIKKFIRSGDVFLEIGPGDGHLCTEVSKFAKTVYGFDVSKKISEGLKIPDNFKLICYDGFNFGLDDNSIDMAYSNSLIEHLHEEDANYQMKNIYAFLKKGGRYICVTCNGLTGPNDISRFSNEPFSCFHLKEYNFFELRKLFLDAGFRKGNYYIFIKGKYYKTPFLLMQTFEYFLKKLKGDNKERLIHSKIGAILLDCVFVGVK